jgi:hypothetical protein
MVGSVGFTVLAMTPPQCGGKDQLFLFWNGLLKGLARVITL